MTEQAKKVKPYVPTLAEQRLMEVLLDPSNRMLSVGQIWVAAKINRKTYYAAFKKPDFREMYKQEALALLRRATMPMVNALIREATRGSAPHLKMGLEAAEVYAEKVKVEHSGAIEVSSATDQELMDWLKSAVVMTPVKKEEPKK